MEIQDTCIYRAPKRFLYTEWVVRFRNELSHRSVRVMLRYCAHWRFICACSWLLAGMLLLLESTTGK